MKVNVSWEDIEQYIDDVCDHYKNKNITGVYGLPRGGLIFAVLLSHKMNIPLLGSPIENCIIIDDICDTGESLVHYYKNSSGLEKPKYHITTMYYKENDLVKPEFYTYKKDDKWIIYGIGGVNAPHFPFLTDRIRTSFINRIKTFCNFIFTKL